MSTPPAPPRLYLDYTLAPFSWTLTNNVSPFPSASPPYINSERARRSTRLKQKHRCAADFWICFLCPSSARLLAQVFDPSASTALNARKHKAPPRQHRQRPSETSRSLQSPPGSSTAEHRANDLSVTASEDGGIVEASYRDACGGDNGGRHEHLSVFRPLTTTQGGQGEDEEDAVDCEVVRKALDAVRHRVKHYRMYIKPSFQASETENLFSTVFRNSVFLS